MFWLGLVSAFLAGAAGRRIAGGVLNTWWGYDQLNVTHPGYNFRVMGDTPARLIYAFIAGLFAVFGGAEWWVLPAMMLCVWIGTTTGNGGGRDAGFGKTSLRHDFLGMSMHALESAAAPCLLVALVLWPHFAGAVILFLFTMMAAPCYWLGWKIGIALGGQEMPPTNDGGVGNGRLFPGLQGGAEWGEALWGGYVVAGTFLAFWV